jgi:hypothetical protein
LEIISIIQNNQSQKESKDHKPLTTNYKITPKTPQTTKRVDFEERNLGSALVAGELLIKEEICDWREL